MKYRQELEGNCLQDENEEGKRENGKIYMIEGGENSIQHSAVRTTISLSIKF